MNTDGVFTIAYDELGGTLKGELDCNEIVRSLYLTDADVVPANAASCSQQLVGQEVETSHLIEYPVEMVA